MSSDNTTALDVSFDGLSWKGADKSANAMPLLLQGDDLLPVIPEGYSVSSLILPAEMLLCRTFALPLSNPRHVDADILAQELDEQSGEEIENWWLSWLVASDGDEVKGVVFGLPDSFRDVINDRWQSADFVGVDLQLRLNAQLGQFAGPLEGWVAVFDSDEQGVIFGVCRTVENSEPVWLGVRRLNFADGLDTTQSAYDIPQTLAAMGWNPEHAAAGLLESKLYDALELPQWSGQTIAAAELPDRHAANLAVVDYGGLNFRHGSWGARSVSGGGLKAWYQPIALAAAVAVIWVAGMLWQNIQLNNQNEQLQEEIVAAFHKGLPNETVMIDALAQLRKAAGNSSAVTANQTIKMLTQIVVVNRVYVDNPWQMKELSYRDGSMQLSGIAKDLATMSRIQQLLQQESGHQITLKDSDLSGSQVKFRMVW